MTQSLHTGRSEHAAPAWVTARAERDQSADQAAGLRRLFDGRATRALAVVSNPAVAWSGLLIEHLSESLAIAGLHTLVVDASETAPVASEWANLDLRWAIEPSEGPSSYLAARGLIRHHVDEQGRAQGLLRRAAEAAPWADVLLVHAPALDLMRLFDGHDWRPILLADSTPIGAMQAYGSLKSMARSGLSTFDILLESSSRPVLGPRVALRLADSASRFLSWPVGHSVVVQGPMRQDPAESSRLQDLIRAQWAQAVTCAVHRTPAFNHERLA